LPIEPLGTTGAFSAGAVALARLADRTLAFVADAEDRAVITVDVDAGKPVASTPIGAAVAAVLVTPHGRIVALGADDARVHVLAMTAVDEPLFEARSVQVPEEPVSAALVPGGATLLVASRWGHALSVVGLGDESATATIDLPRDPTAAVASADGRRAFVMHAAGSRASIVDLEARTSRTVSLDRTIRREIGSWLPMAANVSFDVDPAVEQLDGKAQALPPPVQAKRPAPKVRLETVVLHADQAFALVRLADGRVAAPLVAVDTGVGAQSSGYGGSEAAATAAMISFDRDGQTAPSGARVFGSRCLLPRGAALDPAGGRMLVACLGSDEVAVFRLGSAGAKLGHGVRVPKGPVGVSVDERERRAVVWSAFDRVLSVLSIDPQPKVVARVALPRMSAAPPADVVRGRALFHAISDSRISSDGRACASCHPDGRDDGLAWSSPGGRRQTPMLLERLEGTAPYGWDGTAKDFAHHLAHTTARLGGSGLGNRDAQDIRAYLSTLHPPAALRVPNDAVVARGDALFHSDEAGCAGCHAGGSLTDGDAHDVGSASRGDARHAFDTPSLHLIGHSAPYFHDGRFATLTDLLDASDGTMGKTSQLSIEDRAALVAYLQQL
jgi:DNA-binding beta-propeller fold protein YncE/mono/diheme cytochrome c family protein